MVEDERADERAGAIAAAREERGQRLPIGGKGPRPVVAHTVMQREQPGEKRGMRRKSQRHGGVGRVEAHSAQGHLGQRRRPRADAIGTEGVERDEQDVRMLRRFPAGEQNQKQDRQTPPHGALIVTAVR